MSSTARSGQFESLLRSVWTDRVLLVVGFGSLHLAYSRTQIRFRSDTIDFFAQLLDPSLLQDRLVESLWFLHAQPPLLNLITGIALKVSPENPGAPLHALFVLAGLATCGLLAGVLRRLGAGRAPAVVIALAFTATPPFLLYENWYFYPHLAQALLALAAYGFVRSRSEPGIWMAVGFWALAALVALRSLFHPLYLLIAVAIAVLLSRRGARIRVASQAAAPVAFVLFLAFKNLFLFGFFGTSSWGGNSLHRMMTESLKPEALQHMVEAGELSPLSREWEFSRPEVYLEVLDPAEQDRGIPALDTTGKTRARENSVNYNHWIYPAASKVYFRNALDLIRRHPEAYAKSVAWTWRRFFDPVTDDHFLRPNRFRIKKLAERWERLEASPVARGIFALAWLYGLFAIRRRSVPSGERLFLAFAVGTILWVTAFGVLLEYGENNRFRYQILGLAWVLFVYGARDLVRIARRAGARPRD